MKKLLIYFVAVSAAVLSVACEKTETDGYAAGEGGVVMRLAQTRAVDVSGLTLSDCTTFIYQKGTDSEPTETLIRKYNPGMCPATIKLLAGSYSVKVQWGERPTAAAFDKCFYEGSADFAITAGKTELVTVSCKPQSTRVEVVFDKTIADLLEAAMLTEPKAVVALPDDNDTETTDALTFTESGMGYFTMPEGVTTLAWMFDVVHSEKGEVHKSGEITGVEAGKSYKLTFSYSRDLPGYISVDIAVDETTDDKNDVLVFSQDPEMAGEILDGTDNNPQDFTNAGTTLTMKANGDATVEQVRIYLVEEVPAEAALAATRATTTKETLVWDWKTDGADETRVKVGSVDEWKTLNITLNPAFFSFPMGKTKLRFEMEDSYGSTVDKTATICMNEGIRPVFPADDCDLWANTVTLHAVSASSAPTFKLRQKGTTDWKEQVGTLDPNVENGYMATFVSGDSDWEALENATAGVTVYRPRTQQCVYANNTYEAAVEIDGHEYHTTFTPTVDQPIPNGDMSDASCSCFTTENKTTEFWGSGNNDFAKELCAQGTKSGRSCAHLKSTMAGLFGITMLASGNLFTGTFDRPSTTGTVSFGQNYDWKARPTALHLKYHATVGAVNQQKHKKDDGSHPANKGEQDKAIVYVAIVDWSTQHEVKSGTSGCSGMWLPDEKAVRDEGPIIGYGIFIIDKSTEGSELLDYEIPIYYYDKTTKPSGKYKLVISSATNIYGDYMCGCDSNELWLTDFKWVY